MTATKPLSAVPARMIELAGINQPELKILVMCNAQNSLCAGLRGYFERRWPLIVPGIHPVFPEGFIKLRLPLPNNHAERFDRILMLPPLGEWGDIKHAQHACNFLSRGGRLVALMSEAAFFTRSIQTIEFSEWMADYGAEVYDLPAEAFKRPGIVRGVDVYGRLLVVDKPSTK